MRERTRAKHNIGHVMINFLFRSSRKTWKWQQHEKNVKRFSKWYGDGVYCSLLCLHAKFSLPIYFSISGSSNSSKKILTDSQKKDVSGRFSDFTLFLSIWGAKWKINNEKFMYTFFWQCLKSFCASFKPFFFSFHQRDLNSNSQFMMKSFSTRSLERIFMCSQTVLCSFHP